jgi:hypothetical protein
MYCLTVNPNLRNTHVSFHRKFSSPFGYTATFNWPSGRVDWSPHGPRIRKARAWRKFFDAYKLARRAFFEEVAVVLGGSVAVVDMPDPDTVLGIDVIHKPTRH